MVALCIVLLLVFCQPVLATTYYVAKTSSSDANTCVQAQSVGTAKLTINGGVGCLSSGDTLIVKVGTYNEQLIDIVPSGSVGSPTTILANGNAVQGTGDLVTLLPSGPGVDTTVVFFSNKAYITFDGFVVDSTNITNVTLGVNASDHMIVQNCIVQNMAAVQDPNGAAGIDFTGGTTQSIARNNIARNIGTLGAPGANPIDHGIYVRGIGNIIENNVVSNNISHGIHLYSNVVGAVNDNIIRGNIVHDNGSRGILLAAGDGNIAYNNTVYNNGVHDNREGIGIGFGASNSAVYNNTVTGGSGICINIRLGEGVNSIIKNNICWHTGSDSVSNGGSGSMISNNLLGIDPLFVNEAAKDFHLQIGSPAIDAGVDVGLSFIGAAPDMGAFEFQPLVAPSSAAFMFLFR